MAGQNLNLVPFVSVDHMMKLVNAIGVETFMVELADFIEEDFRRWPYFDKTPRVASHSAEGVIELMPTSDGVLYGFKYVNGHPKNTRDGRQTVTAFGVLCDVATGYPLLLTEMTLLRITYGLDLGDGCTRSCTARIARDGNDRQWRASRVPGVGHAGRAGRGPSTPL
jgi:hypothetical protein